jgi:ferredoxin
MAYVSLLKDKRTCNTTKMCMSVCHLFQLSKEKTEIYKMWYGNNAFMSTQKVTHSVS